MKEKRFFLSAAVMLFFGLLMLFLYNQSIAYEEEETRKKHIDALLLTLENKIDEITKQRDSFIKAHHISMNDVCEHKDKIDEALKLVKKDCIEYGVSDFLEKAMDILKGNKDETGLN